MQIAFAICQLPAVWLPTGIGFAPSDSRLSSQKADGNCRLRLPTCQLSKSQAAQGFRAVGKLADFPLLLRSTLPLPLCGAAAQLRQSHPRKEPAHER